MQVTHEIVNTQKTTLLYFIKVSVCTVFLIFIFQKLKEICALQVECFSSFFVTFTSSNVVV